ncbi:N-ethylammeline chlorohydrolase [Streptococcus pneumoniae]|nr:N-ethylammeline chlorohydrolase [Streptococcus pneumoniae]
MKIKEQTRKLAVSCSKHCFEVADETDEVSSKHVSEVVDETDEVSNHTRGRATLTWFEEIFEERVSIIYLRQGEADVVLNIMLYKLV